LVDYHSEFIGALKFRVALIKRVHSWRKFYRKRPGF